MFTATRARNTLPTPLRTRSFLSLRHILRPVSMSQPQEQLEGDESFVQGPMLVSKLQARAVAV